MVRVCMQVGAVKRDEIYGKYSCFKKNSENMAYGNVPLVSKRETKLNAHWLKVCWGNGKNKNN